MTIDDLLERACAEGVAPGLVDARMVETLLQPEEGVYARLGAATPA